MAKSTKDTVVIEFTNNEFWRVANCIKIAATILKMYDGMKKTPKNALDLMKYFESDRSQILKANEIFDKLIMVDGVAKVV